MQKRAVRLTVLALLLLVGVGAGYFTWDLQRRADDLLAIERDVDARIDRLARRVLALGAAQQAAVLPGQPQAESLARAFTLLERIDAELSALRPRMHSTEAAAALSNLGGAFDRMVRVDTRAREHLRIEQELMAADLVFSEGRQSLDAMSGVLRDLEAAERNAGNAERSALQMQAAMILGTAAMLWWFGLVALARGTNGAAMERANVPPSVASVVPEPASTIATPSPSVNLAEAAEVCTALSRLTAAEALPDLLGRAAKVVDASGIIVWLGAGEELFAVTAHGYEPRVLARLGPIQRNAENATAAAWRAGTLRIVPGDSTANGAVVAPLFGPDGCIGVLATEMRHGRETDDTTRAVIAMIAAQLAAVVAAWPGPSTLAESSRNGATAATA